MIYFAQDWTRSHRCLLTPLFLGQWQGRTLSWKGLPERRYSLGGSPKEEKTRELLNICPHPVCGSGSSDQNHLRVTFTHKALPEDVKDSVTLSDLVMCTSPDSCCFCWHSCTSFRKEWANERKSPWHVYFSNSIEYQEDVLPLLL